MTQAVKDKIIQKISEAGLVVLILGGAVYFLWNDNQNYRLINDKRIERLESQIQDCTNDNIRILREEVQRGHQVIDKNTRAIEKMLER
jgi:hypothetical protein